MVDPQPGRHGPFGEGRKRLERLRNKLLHQFDPGPEPVKRPGQRVERPVVARQRHRVADQAVFARRHAGGQRTQACRRRRREPGGQRLSRDRVQEGG